MTSPLTTRARSLSLPLASALCAMLCVFSLNAGEAHAATAVKQAGNFGLGIGAGTLAAGLSMKYFMQNTFSIQGNVGVYRNGYYGWKRDRCYDYRGRVYCDRGNDALALSVDLLAERGPIAGNGDITLDWEVGGGLGLGIWNDSFLDVAAAFVLGLQLDINVIPIDIVVEYRPQLYLVNGFGFDFVNFTAHIRYYF